MDGKNDELNFIVERKNTPIGNVIYNLAPTLVALHSPCAKSTGSKRSTWSPISHI